MNMSYRNEKYFTFIKYARTALFVLFCLSTGLYWMLLFLVAYFILDRYVKMTEKNKLPTLKIPEIKPDPFFIEIR